VAEAGSSGSCRSSCWSCRTTSRTPAPRSSEYMEFLRAAPEFERMLVRSGIHLVKLWFLGRHAW